MAWANVLVCPCLSAHARARVLAHATLLVTVLKLSFWFRRVGGGFDSFHRRIVAENFIADSIGDGLFGIEETIALGVFANALGWLAGAFTHDLDECVFGFENFFSLDFDIGRLAVHTAE